MFIIYLPHYDDSGPGGNVVLCQNYYDTYSRIYFADSLVNATPSDAIVVVPNGNTSISSSVSKFPGGTSLYFDGSGDNIRIDPINDLAPANLEWTVEAYVYPTANTGTRTIFVQRNSTSTNSPIWIRLSGLTLQVSVRTTFTTSILNAGTLVQNDWNHIVVQRSRIRDQIEVFLNGTLTGVATLNYSLSLTTLLTDYWYVGGDNITNYFQGYIQDFLYTLGVAKYSGTYVPPEEQSNGNQCSLVTEEPPPEYVAFPGSINLVGTASTVGSGGGYLIADSYSYAEISTGNLSTNWSLTCYYSPDGVATGYSTLFYAQSANLGFLTMDVYPGNVSLGPYSPRDKVVLTFNSTTTNELTLPTPLAQYSTNLFTVTYTPNPNSWMGNPIPPANATLTISVNGDTIFNSNAFTIIGLTTSTGYPNGMVINNIVDTSSTMRFGRDFTSLSQPANNNNTRGIRGYVGPFNLS